MTVGRILTNDMYQGCGFALATPASGMTRVVLTAEHVVGELVPASLQFVTQDGRRIPVKDVNSDKNLDVAVLYLDEDVPGGPAVGTAIDGASWQVEAQPCPNDPKLNGTITDTRRRLVKQDSIQEIYVLQLYVQQDLGDYRGYSGSPVVLPHSGAVIGILDEQFLSRFAGPFGQPLPATNVLYAIPIQAALDRFSLTAVSAFPPLETHATSQTLSSIRLHHMNATDAPPVLETHERLITIGRSPNSMVYFPEQDVSWEHGQIMFKEGEYMYCHLSNSKRTILRRRGLEQIFRPGKKEELPLRNQDRLTIGKTTLIVEFNLMNDDSGYTSTANTPEDRDAT